jgi:hypothetical protein
MDQLVNISKTPIIAGSIVRIQEPGSKNNSFFTPPD